MIACLLAVAATLPVEAPKPPEPPIDYLLRVELIGYLDADDSNGPPEDELLRSVETLCRPGRPFLGRTTSGNETITIRGTLDESPYADYAVMLTFSRVVDTGEYAVIAPGVTEKVPDIMSATATIAINVGEPFVCGGGITRSSDTLPDGTIRRRASKQFLRIALTEYEGDATSRAEPAGPVLSGRARPPLRPVR